MYSRSSFRRLCLSTAGVAYLITSFQNCSGSFEAARPLGTSGGQDLSFALASLTADQKLPQTMLNGIDKLGDGRPNPAFGQLIRNIIVTQIAGWSGLPSEEAANPSKIKIDKPLFGGASSYLSKTPAVYEKQARMIAALGQHMAAAILLMDNGDSNASGYGACWNGVWQTDRNCKGGSFVFPQQLYTQFKQAARKQGLQVIPDFSIMNWEQPNAYDGSRFLPKLKAFLAWARPLFDDDNVKTISGKWVVIIDSLPETAGLSPAQKREVHAFMASQSDIFWLDNAVSPIDGLLAPGADNIFGSGWATLAVQKQARVNWNNRFLHWMVVLQQAQRDYTLAQNSAYQYANADLEEEMNLINYRADKYPIVISQWNEYAENLYFEPAEGIGFANYNRLKQWVSRQGPDPVPFVPAQASDFTDPVAVPDYNAIVTKAYKDILERAPDSDGLNYYADLMKNNGRTEAQVRQDLMNSYEYTYKNYYKTYLLRLPTLSEIIANNGNLASGKITLAQLQTNLRQSAECKAQCLTVTPPATTTPPTTTTPTSTDYNAIVTKAYKDILERAPDSDGLNYYAGLMKNNGRTEAQVRQDLMNSNEYTYKNYYKTYLLRLPTLSEIIANNGNLSSGKTTLAQLQNSLRKSPECKSQCLISMPSSSGKCESLITGQWTADNFGTSPRSRQTTAAACMKFCNDKSAYCCNYSSSSTGNNCTAFNTPTCKDKWQVSSTITLYSGAICR